MAICESVSGGSNITRFLPAMMDQPPGAVKVAPPGVTRWASAESFSGAELASVACGDARTLGADVAHCAKVLNVRRASRAVRCMDMLFTSLVVIRKNAGRNLIATWPGCKCNIAITAGEPSTQAISIKSRVRLMLSYIAAPAAHSSIQM